MADIAWMELARDAAVSAGTLGAFLLGRLMSPGEHDNWVTMLGGVFVGAGMISVWFVTEDGHGLLYWIMLFGGFMLLGIFNRPKYPRL